MATDSPPKPEGNPLFGNALAFREDPLGSLTRWSEKLGDIFEIDIPFRNLYALTHPEYIQRVIETESRKFRVGQLRKQGFKGFTSDAIVLTDGERWKRLRRVMQPYFTPKKVSQYRRIMARETDRLIDAWEPDRILDLYEEMSKITIRVVSRCLMGHDLAGNESTVKRAGDGLVHLSDVRKLHSALPNWIPTPAMVSYRRAKNDLYECIDDIIRQKQNNGDGTTLLEHMVDSHREGELSRPELRENLLEFFLAGSDTSSAALTFTFYLLGKYPAERRKLEVLLEERFELDGFDPDRVNEHNSFQNAVEEAMRIFPPAFSIARTAAEKVSIGGYDFQEGDHFLCPQWVVHRDKRFFDAPLEYRPNRWENCDEWPEYAEFPFGGGDRYCIGSHFAMMEMPIIVARLLQRVDYKLLTDEIEALVPSVTLRPEQPVRIKVKEVRTEKT